MSDVEKEDRTICFCHNVHHSAIVSAIRAGADNLGAIQSETCASTGCGGCEYEVLDILEEELAKLAVKPEY